MITSLTIVTVRDHAERVGGAETGRIITQEVRVTDDGEVLSREETPEEAQKFCHGFLGDSRVVTGLTEKTIILSFSLTANVNSICSGLCQDQEVMVAAYTRGVNHPRSNIATAGIPA